MVPLDAEFLLYVLGYTGFADDAVIAQEIETKNSSSFDVIFMRRIAISIHVYS